MSTSHVGRLEVTNDDHVTFVQLLHRHVIYSLRYEALEGFNNS